MVKNKKEFYGLKLGKTKLGLETDIIKNSCEKTKKIYSKKKGNKPKKYY